MYGDWPSELIPQTGWGDENAIGAFKDAIPWTISRDFVAGTAKHLYEALGLNKPCPPTKSNIVHDKQLQILMPALGYGLSFPLSEHEVIRNCVYIYNEWLSALLPEPKACVPAPILQDPNFYARIIINHFYYLFVPRSSQAVDEINKQALLCHRVLRTLQEIAKNSSKLAEATWQTLLLFMLHINSALLSPPTVKTNSLLLLEDLCKEDHHSDKFKLNWAVVFTRVEDDAGEQLGERVLSVLFETWLLACAKSFPPPPLWSALRESCQRWRHRNGLIDQWNRINIVLTVKLLAFMYGSEFVSLKVADEDMNIIPSNISKDCIAQVWFRILHIIGNPVDLSKQVVISKTPAFLQYAISAEFVIEPSQHPCLTSLPRIFLSAMKGVSAIVNGFLGISCDAAHVVMNSKLQNKKENEFDLNMPQAKGKPKCNSILHLFGPWLFEAASIGCNFGSHSKLDHTNSSSSANGSRRPTSVYIGDARKVSDSSLSSDNDKPLNLSPDHFQAGRAEALGALCRIFCSKKSGEEIRPVYLSRFYMVLQEGLKLDEEVITPSQESMRHNQVPYKRLKCSETAASILLNGMDLFRLDLDGITTLMPSILNVLSLILLEYWENPSFPQHQPSSKTDTLLLRRAATQVLLSILPLPLHFQGLYLKELNAPAGDRIRMSHYKPQLVNLLSGALRVETNGANIQMLLAGLVFCVQDNLLSESLDTISQRTAMSDREATLVSSATSDTMSSLGTEPTSWVDDISDADSSSFPPPVPKHLADPDSSHGLYVRTIYLVSHCLMSSWTKDVNVCLAGLELLSSLALHNFGEREVRESKCAVRWLCDYIVFQCSRPPQAHSKDLHSTIVAAFHCTSVWLVAHPFLLQDEECLATVLEVIELGISGSKSQSKSGEPIKFKQDKELKPVSMRVRDSAEALLSSVLSQVGNFPSICGVESLSSLLDETVLLKHCNSYGEPSDLTKATALPHFRYFITQNSHLLALLEQPLVNHEDPQPTVTALIRGPFGRSAWTMQLRHLPRHKSSAKLHISNPGRPLPINDTATKPSIKHKYFPDSTDRIPACKADKSIPTLEQVINSNDKSAMNHEKMLRFVEKQISFEESATKQMEGQKKPAAHLEVETECVAPPLCQEFQTARLLLSHLGLLSLENIQINPNSTMSVPYLIALDTAQPSFIRDLESLDLSNNRTIDTAHVFYVKPGQNSVEDILSNASLSDDLNAHYSEMLKGLGWPVNVHSHSGWTGNVSTAFSVNRQSKSDSEPNEYLYNGEHEVLYWADCLSEMAFVIPSAHHFAEPSDLSPNVSGEKSDSLWHIETEVEDDSLSSHTSQVSVGSENRTRRLGRQAMHSYISCKVFIVWLESLDDADNFPVEDLMPYTMTGLEPCSWKEASNYIFILFVHPLANGLYRIKMLGHLNKLSLAGPLVSGQVVSRRVLGVLIRQTCLNMCRRRRLESDNYQPPHVRRKFRIQDMAQKYQSQMDEAEFYTHLFTSPLG